MDADDHRCQHHQQQLQIGINEGGAGEEKFEFRNPNLNQAISHLKDELDISIPNLPHITHLASASLLGHATEEVGCSFFAVLCGGSSNPALQHFRDKLQLGFRGALAACLTLGLSFLWSWSGTSTWTSMVFAVAVMKKNLGETIVSFLGIWKGLILMVPLLLVLSFLKHSKIWTGVGIYVAISLIYVNSGVTDLGKRLSAVILCIVVLFCAVKPEISYYEEGSNLLIAMAFANIFAIFAIIFPAPRLAIFRIRLKIKTIQRRLASLVRAFDLAFSMNEDVHFSMIAQLIEEARAALDDVKQRLPYIKWEIAFFRLDPQMHTRVTVYAELVEKQLHLFKGMQASLQCIQPNCTQANFLLYLEKPLSSLMQASVAISDEVANIMRRDLRLFQCLVRRGQDSDGRTKDLTKLLNSANGRLEELSMQFLKARLAILFGLKTPLGSQIDYDSRHPEDITAANQQLGDNIVVEVMPSPATMPQHPLTLRGGTRLQFLRRETSGEVMLDAFVRDYARRKYDNVLPRDAFLLDLSLYVRSLEDLVQITCNAPAGHTSRNPQHHEAPIKKSYGSLLSQLIALMKAWINFACGTCPPAGGWLQSFKIGLAITIASMGVLVDGAENRLGRAPIWSVLAACFVSSSHPASSVQGGFTRILGTCLGIMYGLCSMELLQLTSPTAMTLSLGVWIFFCCFHRESPTHGGIAVIAAFTAPMIMVGYLHGTAGAVKAIEQTIAGVMLYIAVDNAFCPKRAKMELREELATSIEIFSTLWKTSLDLFLSRNASHSAEAKDEIHSLRNQLKASFCKQQNLILLAEGEPELWHKPFQAKAYRKVLSSLTQVSVFLSMLTRASTFLPDGVNVNDFEMLELIKRAVEDLQQVNSQALKEAHDAVNTMKHRNGGGKDKAQVGASIAGMKVQSLALLRLRKQYTALQDFVDDYMEEYLRQSKGKTDHVLVSGDVILYMNGVLFALKSIGEHMLSVGHAIRELVEGESNSYYLL